MSSLVRRFRVASVIALALLWMASSLPLRAQERPRTVSLDLNGTWKDSRGNDVQITQSGTSVTIQFRSGALFSGALRGRQLEVKHSLSFEETRKNLPTAIRGMIAGEEVSIRGAVNDAGDTIEATYYDRDPEWEEKDGEYKILRYREGGRPMNFFRGELRIADISIDYTPWFIAQTELKRKLQSAKDDVRRAEEAVTARQGELEGARAACPPKEAALESLQRQLAAARATAQSSGPPEAQKTRAYKNVEARLQRLVARENQLYDRITRAKEYSSNITPHVVLRMLE
ncbi:MAG: hypothetical protein ACRD3I_01690 [Terriglobales bacterium]